MCFLLQAVHVSLDLHQTTAPASSPCLIQIGDSALNVTFIQSSTAHDCLSLAHCGLVYFCLGVTNGSHLACLDGIFLQPVSNSLVTNTDCRFN